MTVIINGRRLVLERAEGGPMSYEDVVRLVGDDPNRIYSVTWKTPDRSGILSPGQYVDLVDGMVFNAVVTGNA